MPLATGSRLGPYQILAPIGVGGMGEVYRAKDTRLDRDVAIKVLPHALAGDPERLARFEREAKVLAALNHPNIATIYAVEESPEGKAIALELVPGQTLKAPLAIGTALNYARQIAEALEAAHEKGITHRDLKPANIMITPEGVVKILDFGLASIPGREAGGDPQNSPTMTIAATQAGMIMGTAAYMSPEQAAGKVVDKRSDIWSFGVVLWEMITGARLFDGETISHTLAHVLTAPIDFSQVKTPGPVAELLKRCLERDPRRRLRDIGEARIAIEKYIADPKSGTEVPLQIETRAKLRWAWAVAAALAVIAAGLGVSMLRRQAGSLSPARLSVVLPPAAALAVGGNGPALIVSPDGKQIVYAGRSGDTTRLYVRPLDQFEAKPISGTEGAQIPFFSPDGASIGFTTDDKLKTVALAGGPVLTLADVYQGGYGATWGPGGQIVFNSGRAGEGLFRIAATGGKPEVVSRLNVAADAADHVWPEMLPGGEAILFTSTQGESLESANVEALSLKTGQRRILIQGGGNARYVPPGHLVFARSGVLFTAPFDVSKLIVTGPSVPVLEGVLTLSTDGPGQFSVSPGGTLVYAPGGTLYGERSLVWVDQKGSVQPITPLRRPFEDLSVSPDGRRIALTIEGPAWNIWILEIARGTLSRLTLEQDNRDPFWTPDGKRVVYSSFREGHWGLYWKPADGGPEERLLTSDTQPWANTWSPDGVLLYSQPGPGTGRDLLALTLSGGRKPRVFLQTKFSDSWAAISPDGHWLAYVSDESGHDEVYVQAYPGPGNRVQVSTDGGQEPVWAPDGRRLFFRNGEKLMAAAVNSKPAFSVGAPKMLFEGRYKHAGHDYGVSGERFVFIKEAEQSQGQTEIRVLQNWGEELQRVSSARN